LHGAVQVQARAVGDGGAREGVGGLLRIGVAVAGRVHAADPAAGEARHDGVEVPGAQQTGRQAVLARHRQPRLEAGHARLVSGEREVAALDPLDVGVQLAPEALPQTVGLDDQRHLQRIAALLADEAPVLPRLLAGHGAALHDDDPRATASEEVGGGAANDAGSDDDDVRVTLHGRGASSVKVGEVSNAPALASLLPAPTRATPTGAAVASWGGRLGDLDGQRATAERRAVELLDGGVGGFGGRHFHEAEAPRLAGITIGHDGDVLHTGDLAEELTQLVGGGAEGNAADEKLLAHDVSPDSAVNHAPWYGGRERQSVD
jgi:hypothetical protein